MKAVICLLSIACLICGCATSNQAVNRTTEGEGQFYVADIAKVGESKYFRIIEKIRCEEFDRTIFMFNPPDWPIGWARRERLVPRTVTERCVSAFSERANSGRLENKGGNGILVDGTTWELIGEYKIGADSWLVRFGEPNKDEIRKILHAKAKDPIEILQKKAVLHWLERNRATEFIEDIKAALPPNLSSEPVNGWGDSETRALKALASMDSSPRAIWLDILRAGIYDAARLDAKYVVAGDTGEHAMLAGQMLGCSGRHEAIQELRDILEGATIAPHKLAAAKALVTLGDIEVVRGVAARMKPSPVQQLIQNMAAANLPYKCKGSA